MLLFIGLIIGCFNAWHWVHSEYKEIQEDFITSHILDLAPALAGWRVLGAFFFGGLWRTVQRALVRESGDLVPRQSAAADGRRSLASTYFRRTLVEARGVPLGISVRTYRRRELAHEHRRKSKLLEEKENSIPP